MDAEFGVVEVLGDWVEAVVGGLVEAEKVGPVGRRSPESPEGPG